MQYISNFLRSIVIITLFSTIVNGISNSKNFDPVEQTVKAIEDCIVISHAPWPGEWNQEYIETIRNVVESHRDASNFAERLEILGKGFAIYWKSFKRTPERSLFKIYQAQIRWYTEYLMGSDFPTEAKRQKLLIQYTDIWNYAANSLLAQFPFLNPNTVETAKTDDLNECYRKIDSSLLPIYMRPMSEEQVEKIKQRWDKLRYIRVDLWRSLGGNPITETKKFDTLTSDKELDYKLTRKSFSQLLGLVWMVIPERPGYYLSAIENRNKALRERFQLNRQAHHDQQRLGKTHSRQMLQTEHISFLFAALLETTYALMSQLSSVFEIQSKWNGIIGL